MNIRPSFTATVAVLLGPSLLGGCNADPEPPAPNPSRSNQMTSSATTDPSATATPDPRAKAAVEAYVSYFKTSKMAATQPPGIGGELPKGGDFVSYSFDPAQTATRASLVQLHQAGHALSGTPPVPEPSVVSVDLTAKPYPTVILHDCAKPSSTWKVIDSRTGKPVSNPPPKVPPPYQDTVTVISHEGHWGVQEIKTDTTATCQS